MVTIFEEAMDLLDAAHGIVEMTFDTFETEPVLSSALYGIKHLLDESIRLLCIVESEDKEEARTALEDAAQASAKTNQSNSITYHEMMSKQYDDSEGLNEIPTMSGTNDALDELIESAPKPEPKVDLKDVHNLRMSGKKAQDIADSYGVPVSTVYGWFKQIKQKHPRWVEDWNRGKRRAEE